MHFRKNETVLNNIFSEKIRYLDTNKPSVCAHLQTSLEDQLLIARHIIPVELTDLCRLP